MKLGNGAVLRTRPYPDAGTPSTTVVVAVESARVREALVAMLDALEHFRVVGEVDTADAAVEVARTQHPDLAVVELELSGCWGWWAIKQIQAERLARVVVALGRRAEATPDQLIGVGAYVQMGTSPRDLRTAVEAAMRSAARVSGPDTEQDLLTNTHPVLDKPALVDF